MKKWMVGILGILMVIAISTAGFTQEYLSPPRENSGIIGGRGGQAWSQIDVNKIVITEISSPATSPPSDHGWLYIVDGGGSVSTLYFKDAAGTPTNLLTGSTPKWDDIADPDANSSISLGNYTNIFTGTLINGAQNTFTDTGNMTTGGRVVVIQQMTGNPDANAIILEVKAADTDPKLLSLNSGSEVLYITGAGVITGGAVAIDYTDFDVSADGAIILSGDDGGTMITLTPSAAAVGIDASNATITTALSVGANDIVGTTGLINYTNFDVNADGDVTCVDITASGTVSIGIFKQDSLVPASASPADIALNAGGAGGINIGSVSTGTITLGGGSVLVNLPAATDLTLAGGQLSITDTATANVVAITNNTMTTNSALIITANAVTSGKVISVTADALDTGTMLYLDSDGIPASTYYIQCYDGAANDFLVGADGKTTITGTASGTDALTLTNGDILVTAGNIDITTGNFAIGTGYIALGADPADAGAIRLSNATYIESEKAATGVDINIIGVDGSDIIQIGASGSSGAVITPATTITGILTLSANPRIYDGDSNYVTLDAPNIAGDITVVLPATAGTVQLTTGTPAGFIIASQTTGDILQSTDSTNWERLAGNTAGKFLRAGGVATKNAWSTLILPNSATQGDILHASGANTIGNLAAVATGQVLVSAGASTAPAWSASPTLTAITVNTMTHSNLTVSKPVFTNSAGVLVSTGTLGVDQGGTNVASYAVGDVLYASGATTLSKLAAVATGQTLESAGTTTAPAYKDKNTFSYAALAMVPDSLVTFSTTQARTLLWKLTSSSGTAVPVITAPNTSGQVFLIRNSTGQTVTIKVSGQSGNTIASTKTALAYCDGSDYLTVAMD